MQDGLFAREHPSCQSEWMTRLDARRWILLEGKCDIFYTAFGESAVRSPPIVLLRFQLSVRVRIMKKRTCAIAEFNGPWSINSHKNYYRLSSSAWTIEVSDLDLRGSSHKHFFPRGILAPCGGCREYCNMLSSARLTIENRWKVCLL